MAGAIHLAVARRGWRTRPVRSESFGMLRLMRPLYLDDSGQATYLIVNSGGAYFGERYRMTVEVEPGASLLLSSQSATRIHRTPCEPAVQEATFTVGAGSRLEYVPDQVIAYRDARYQQDTTIVADAAAQAFVAEILTPGWDPAGTPFTYGQLQLRTTVREPSSGRLVYRDNVRLEPAALGDAISGIGHLEGATHLASVLVLGSHTAGDHADAVRRVAEEQGRGSVEVGVTTGSRHGVSWLVVRALGHSTDALRAVVLAINEHDRGLTQGQSRLDLRRY